MKYSNFTRIAAFSLIGTLVLLASCKERTGSKTDTGATNSPKGNQTYSDSATSSVRVYDENGKVCIQQSSTYYQLVDFYKVDKKVPLLLKIKKVELCYADSSNKDKVYEIEAHNLPDNEPISWKATLPGTELQVKDNTLLLVHEGGDNEEDYITRYNLQTGERVFGSTYGDLRIAIPNVREKRFMGYTSQRAAGAAFKQEENLLGYIEYGKGTAPISKLKVYLKRSGVADKIPNYTPEMVFVSPGGTNSVMDDGKQVILMKADEKYTAADVNDFALQLTFYFGDDNESTVVTIPVKNDKVDLAAATYDKQIFNITE